MDQPEEVEDSSININSKVSKEEKDILPIEDDKSVVVCNTNQLTPFANDVNVLDIIEKSIKIVAMTSSFVSINHWDQYFNAAFQLRRAIVQHNRAFDNLSDTELHKILKSFIYASDNLRSSVARNALLAIAEMLEFLPREGLLRICISPFHINRSPTVLYILVATLLRRHACEKRFLREAAQIAIDKLVNHLSSLELCLTACEFATSKTARSCDAAARILTENLITICKVRKEEINEWPFDLTTDEKCTQAMKIFKALITLRSAKDAIARSASFRALQCLGKAMGRELLEQNLSACLDASQRTEISQLLQDLFEKNNDQNPSFIRRGSLREKILQKRSISWNQQSST